MRDKILSLDAGPAVAPQGRREELLASIPRWYRGWAHFALINLVGAGAVALAIGKVEDLRAWEVLFVPAFFAFANLFEWWIHRGPMHHPRSGLRLLHRRHTLVHHVVFTSDRMAIAEPRQLALVLFPPLFPVLFAAMVAPLPFALGVFVSSNLGWLFYACALSYYVIYEWFHTCHHLPPESWLGRRALVRRARAHHARHHDPARMTRGNFNVSFPLWDWLLGTWLR